VAVLDLQEAIPLLGNGASVIEDLRRQVKRQEDVEELLPNGIAGRYLTWYRTVGVALRLAAERGDVLLYTPLR
jgi:hypothetical protein